jgi:hypothetical protein
MNESERSSKRKLETLGEDKEKASFIRTVQLQPPKLLKFPFF